MVTVPEPDRRDVIVRGPFLNDSLGEIVAWHDKEGPIIDFHLAPLDTEDAVEFGLTPTEARALASQLREIADAAQRAGWTSAVLADVRQNYLPGATDDEIIAKLDALADRNGGFVLGFKRGTVNPNAGRMLTAEVGAQAVQRASTALDDAVDRLGEFRAAVDQLTQLRAALDELQRFYQSESERKR